VGAILSQQLDAVTAILVTASASAALLTVVIIALVNLWAIMDPRMGSTVKGALLRVAFSLALFAAASGGSAIMRLA
jgi:hypothetical protein